MVIIFGIIVLRALLIILAVKAETRRLKSDPKLNRKMRIRGFLTLIITFILMWFFTYLGLIVLVFICSTLALLALYLVIYGARSVSKYEGLRLAGFLLGLYVIIVVPVHEAFGIAPWGYTTFPMDPKNEILLIVGTAFLIAGVSLLRERVGYFTVWFLGNVVIFLIPLHEFFDFMAQEVYEPFDHGLIILGSALIITGYLIFFHRFHTYKKIEMHLENGLEFFHEDHLEPAFVEFEQAFWLVEGANLIMDFDILWGLLGNTYFKQMKYDKALAHYQVALLINEKNPTIHNDLGNSYFYLRRYRRSLDSYDKALSLDSTNPIIHHNKALVLYSIGRFEDSLEYFDNALELKPDFDIAWKDRGIALVNLERYEEAIESFEKAIEIRDATEAWFEMGRVYLYKEDYEKALECCNKTVQYFPSDDKGYLGTGLCLMKLSRFEEAEAALLLALELNENNARTWDRLGNVKYVLNEPNAAVQAFRRAIAFQPNYGTAKFNLARVLKKEGNDEEALDTYDQAVRNQGRTPQEEEKFHEAKRFYELMKRKRPADYKPWMYHGNLLLKRGALHNAIEQYDRALTLKAHNARIWNLKGIAHRKNQQHDMALASFKRAVEVDPEYTEGYINIGNIYQIREEYFEAVNFYNKALELTPEQRQAIRNRRICINKLRRSQRMELVPTFASERRLELQKLKSTILRQM